MEFIAEIQSSNEIPVEISSDSTTLYPHRDFRSLINNPHTAKTAWRSMLREPFQELLTYWEKSGKPESLKDVYCQGIYEGIIKDRWPCCQLNRVDQYPEFYICVRAGLEKAWSNLKFTLARNGDDFSLNLDSGSSDPVNFSNHEMLRILELMKQRLSLELEIDDKLQTVGIFPSKRAREIYQKIFWLDSAIGFNQNRDLV
jgi:hypothetical protein